MSEPIALITEPDRLVPGYILRNSFCRACGCAPAPLGCECSEPDHIPTVPMDAKGCARGRSVVICGAGPSLAAAAPLLGTFDEVWACNRALTYLAAAGLRVTHAVAIEPAARIMEAWPVLPDVVYYLATCVHPTLTERVARAHRVVQFHSMQTARPIDETTLYALLYPKTVLTHTGMSVVNRALDLAAWLGYSRIRLAGCDLSIQAGAMYADGQPYEGAWTLTGTVDGRTWRTKPDMLYSALDLVRVRRSEPRGRIGFIGTTLPRALQDKPESFLQRCIRWEPKRKAA